MGTNFGFLLFDQFEDLDFFGPWEMIGLWSQQFNGPEKLILISETKGSICSSKGLKIQTDTNFSDCPPLNYLLIPGGQGTRTEVYNDKLTSFISSQYGSCRQLLSVCTGAFLLQAANLLKGKKATTHWKSLERLKLFDELEVIEARFLKQNNIWLSAGVSAGIDMTLAFIAETAGEKTAGNIQLQAEYYPSQKVYENDLNYYPKYYS